MLLTKEVEVVLSGNTVGYYESKGYVVPRVQHPQDKSKMVVKSGTKIKVKAEDLKPNSCQKIQYCCDNCNKVKTTTWQAYLHQLKDDGKNYCISCTRKLFYSKENNPSYKPIKERKEKDYRADFEYINFKKRVLKRDDYTCKCCKKKDSRNCIVHHLDGYEWCIEKRCDDTNGITLCESCHKNFHLKYGYGGNTKEQFEEWIGCSIGELEKYNGTLPTCKVAYCIEDGEIIPSVKKYAKEHNYTDILIYNCCNQKINTAYSKHYVWYKDYKKNINDELVAGKG